MSELPKWVLKFNKSSNVSSYLKKWETFYNIKTYHESGSDLNEFERGFNGKETATFPYDLKKLSEKNGGYDIIKFYNAPCATRLGGPQSNGQRQLPGLTIAIPGLKSDPTTHLGRPSK